MLRQITHFILLLGVTSAAVHKFLARPYRLSDESARIRQNTLERMHFNEIRKHFPAFYNGNELEPSIALNHSIETHFVYLTNITIGTPAQTFVAQIDFFYATDLCVISSSANLSYVSHNVPPKHTFDSSGSSSFVDLNGNFSDWGCGNGKNGSDQLTVDTASANVVMLVVEDTGDDLDSLPIDAVLGLNPTTSLNNRDNLVSQLVAGLDKPIASWWQNESSHYDGLAQLTLGGEDTDNCQATYVYAPQIQYHDGLYSDYSVHLASGGIDGMSNYVKGLNTTLKLWPGHSRIYCGDDFFYLLTNASNASWNETIRDWEVDCDVTKAKNITLNIGSNGNIADGNTKQLILTGADYIEYFLTYRFLNNHCLAYNTKEKAVGFADAKWINMQLRTPQPPSTAQRIVQH